MFGRGGRVGDEDAVVQGEKGVLANTLVVGQPPGHLHVDRVVESLVVEASAGEQAAAATAIPSSVSWLGKTASSSPIGVLIKSFSHDVSVPESRIPAGPRSAMANNTGTVEPTVHIARIEPIRTRMVTQIRGGGAINTTSAYTGSVVTGRGGV